MAAMTLVLPLALADETSGQISASFPAAFRGNLDFSDPTAIFAAYDVDNLSQFGGGLKVRSGSVVLYRATREFLEFGGQNIGAPNSQAKIEREPVDWNGTSARIRSAQAFATLWVDAAASQLRSTQGSILGTRTNVTVSSGPGRSTPSLEPTPVEAGSKNLYLHRALGTRYQLQVPNATFATTGRFEFYVSGLQMELEGPGGPRTLSTGEERTSTPLLGGGHLVRIVRTALVGNVSGEANLRTAGNFVFVLLGKADIENVTEASLPVATGHFLVEGQERRVDEPRHLEVLGHFSVLLPKPVEAQTGFGFIVHGEIQDIQQDFLGPFDWFAGPSLPAAAISLAALLAAALAYAFRDFLANGFARISFPLYTKLQRSNILENRLRDAIYHAIKSSPGVTFQRLRETVRRDESDLPPGEGTLEHHLSHLQKFGLVSQKKMGRHRRYFVQGDADAKARALAIFLEEPLTRAIAEGIARRPGIAQKDLAASIQPKFMVSVMGVRYHLVRLEREGLVQSIMRGRKRVYQPLPKLDNVLANQALEAF
jgi:predicted transcriptional regulator